MFQVDWSDDSLLGDLCQIYLDHRSQSTEITHSCDRIELLLRTSARSVVAEVSTEGLRKLRHEPIEVIYSIDAGHVEVQAVKWIGFTVP
jgi:hypothetical protein